MREKGVKEGRSEATSTILAEYSVFQDYQNSKGNSGVPFASSGAKLKNPF